MDKKLSWEAIQSAYANEWVELVDYESDEIKENPRSGVVYRHSKERKELHDLFMKDPVDESAIVFTGTMKVREGSIFSANLHQYPGGSK